MLINIFIIIYNIIIIYINISKSIKFINSLSTNGDSPRSQISYPKWILS